MLRTTDVAMILMMTAAATVTYSIKHRAELKLDDVRKLESDIRLEKDTIDLLKADWALLTQPNRLQRLVAAYQADLQLVPTASTQLAQPTELPMLKAEVPKPEEPDAKDSKTGKKTDVPIADAGRKPAGAESVEAIIGKSRAAAPAEPDGGEDAGAMNEADDISTGSVEQ